jgi:hypothetical protein
MYIGMAVTEPVEIPVWISTIEIIVPLLITGLVLATYFFHKRRHALPSKRRNKE